MAFAAKNEYYISSLDDTKIHIEEIGEGPNLILLAGGPGFNASYMYPVAEVLSKDHHVVVLHQRGTGKSNVAVVNEEKMSMLNYCSDIEAVRRHLDLEKLVLVGHSWGAMLAMEYTAMHHNHVEKLIMLGPGGPTPKFTTYVFDNISKNLLQSDLDEAKSLADSNEPPFKANWNGYFFDRESAVEHKNKINWDNFYGQANVDAHTIPAYFATTESRVSGLSNFSGLACIIQGEQDPMEATTIIEIDNLISNCQIEIISDCGHFPWLEKEDQSNTFYTLLFDALKA